jgi:hypothetical protein
MLYHLKCVLDLDLRVVDGRLFVAGHDAQQLSRSEAAWLLANYPAHFVPGNQATEQLLADGV